jgi:release factor glutamine methyltransferase
MKKNAAVKSGETSSGPNDRWTVRRILEWTAAHLEKHGSEAPRLEAEILLAHSRGCRRIELYTHFDDVVGEGARAEMRELVRRRAAAEPVAYLVGHREFFGLDFRVTPDVLIPRPDTETLVVELLEIARSIPEPRILDVGAGSGCIVVAAAVNLPRATLTAVDISPKALGVARQNAAQHGVAGRIRFLEGDLFGPLEAGEQFDVIASNPPYVADGELETLGDNILRHEPRIALSAGPDGLAIISRLIADAPQYLAPAGHLLLEISPEQAAAVTGLLKSAQVYEGIATAKDLSGRVRVVRARRIS